MGPCAEHGWCDYWMGVWLLTAGGVSTTGIWQEILGTGQPIKRGKSLESEQEQGTIPCFGRDWEDVRMGLRTGLWS